MENTAIVGIYDRQHRWLVSKRSDSLTLYPSLWSFPGGHLEDGEKAVDAAIRELLEETGLIVAKEQLAYSLTHKSKQKGRCHLYLMAYVGAIEGQQPVNKEPHKHSDWVWMPEKTLITLPLIPTLEVFFHGR